MAATLREAIRIARTKPNDESSLKLLKAIHQGKMDKIAAEEGIDLTALKEYTAKAEEESKKPMPTAADAVKTVIDIADPKNFAKNALKALPTVAKGAAIIGNSLEPLSPEEKAALRMEEERKKAATQRLNNSGFVPPSTVPIKDEILKNDEPQRFTTAEEVEDVAGKVTPTPEEFLKKQNPIFKPVNEGLKQVGEGVDKVIGEGDIFNPKGVEEGRPWESLPNPKYDKELFREGFFEIMNGANTILTSPIAAGVEPLPEDIKKPLSQAADAVLTFIAEKAKEHIEVMSEINVKNGLPAMNGGLTVDEMKTAIQSAVIFSGMEAGHKIKAAEKPMVESPKSLKSSKSSKFKLDPQTPDRSLTPDTTPDKLSPAGLKPKPVEMVIEDLSKPLSKADAAVVSGVVQKFAKFPSLASDLGSIAAGAWTGFQLGGLYGSITGAFGALFAANSAAALSFILKSGKSLMQTNAAASVATKFATGTALASQDAAFLFAALNNK